VGECFRGLGPTDPKGEASLEEFMALVNRVKAQNHFGTP